MNNKILALLTAVVFAAGAVTGATAATGDVPVVGSVDQSDADDTTQQPTANITDVEIKESEYTVETDSDDVDRIRVLTQDGGFIHESRLPGLVTSMSFPLNWSNYEVQQCGYSTTGPTQIRLLDEDMNELDRTEVNISAQTQVCK